MDIEALNTKYAAYDHRQRLEAIFQDFDRVLITSSFGTTAVILLHYISKVKPEHPVHFIDTTYHFEETHQFRRALTDRWNLNVLQVLPPKIENKYTLLTWSWTYAPDDCCEVNKVYPMEGLKNKHDVWISGMIGGTNANRKEMPIFKHDGQIMRFYPFIDMTPEEADWYKIANDLPPHPMEAEGYGSIGCTHCTKKGAGREGRWSGTGKTECGLHKFG